MIRYTVLLVALALGALACANAADHNMTAAEAFSDSITYEMKVTKCVKALPDRTMEFKDALDAWTKSHAALIAQGKQIIVREGQQTNRNTVAMLVDTKEWLLSDFPGKTKEDHTSQCDTFLKTMLDGA